MRGLFVTGTDTDVGKTTVSLALLRAAAQRGLSIAAMKAVETGCRREADQLVPADALHLRAACWPSSPPPIELVCPHRFELPVAPSVAARAAGSASTSSASTEPTPRSPGATPICCSWRARAACSSPSTTTASPSPTSPLASVTPCSWWPAIASA